MKDRKYSDTTEKMSRSDLWIDEIANEKEESEAEEAPDAKLTEERRQETDQRTRLDKVLEWVLPLGFAIAIAVLIRVFVGGTTEVQGESMMPTLHDGDYLIVNKLPTYRQDYKRADIVIIDAPHLPDKFYIKRIIGLPGERVRILDGKIYINDQLLQENYIPPIETTTYNETEWLLGTDEYFVLGDNRIHGKSNDGRMFGPVEGKHIRGVAVWRIWPLQTFGALF